MPTIETSIEIARPPETVAEAFLDPVNATYWEKDLKRFEVISRKPGEVGSLAHLHYVQGGRSYVLEDVLEAMVPNRYFRSKVTGAGLEARVETWLREKNGHTVVTMRWAGSGTTWVTRLMLPFMRRALVRQTRSELETFKSLVEARGAHFSTQERPVGRTCHDPYLVAEAQ
jgi:hypothetical protein